MPPASRPSKSLRFTLLLFLAVGVLFFEIILQSSLVQARGQTRATLLITATRTKRPEKLPTLIISKYGRLCGELVFLADFKDPTIKTIGLRPCGGQAPLIFWRHPRDLVPFYQIRDAEIDFGEKICTLEYGCLNEYIETFDNYVGIESCDQCGLYNLPPTWTQAPLTPYTPTPIPPTKTPWPTPVSPSPSPTLAPGQVTPTPNLFGLLFGTETPTPSPQQSATLTSTAQVEATALPAAATGQAGARTLCPASVAAFVAPLAFAFWGRRKLRSVKAPAPRRSGF